MSTCPELVASAIIRNRAGSMLLIRQKKWANTFSCFIGGHVEYGEPVLSALEREIMEEVGLHVTDIQFLRWDEWIVAPPRFHREAHLVFLNFVCLADDSEVRLSQSDEIQEALWTTLEDARELVNQEARPIIDRLLADEDARAASA